MKVLYNNIFDYIKYRIAKIELNNRKVKKIILTPREFGELQKEFAICRTDAHNYTIMGVPLEVE